MLTETLVTLPNTPGIYQFFDSKGHLLYIGKAKVLKNRVKSYFRFTPNLSPSPTLSARIHNMISQVARLEYLVVSNEHDAFILENSLIKQLKPKYNILLRDDKTYPYIYIDFSSTYPRFDITRKIVKGKNIRYFGPFSSGARALLEALYLIFPLVQKRGCERVKKACLFYQMGRCLAPCEEKISKEEYLRIVNKTLEFIHRPKAIIKALEEKMTTYAKALHFEEAAKLRDQIEQIEQMERFSHLDSTKLENFDLFAVHIEEKSACALRLFIREGKVVSSSHSIAKSVHGFDVNELYHSMILNAYPLESPCLISTLYIAHPVEDTQNLSLALKQRHNKTIYIKHPLRGEKHHLCNLALTNANELLLQHNRRSNALIEKIFHYFSFTDLPYAIEVFDNSHLGGEATVGAMVVWENEVFAKDRYRRFHLKAKDEYSQMKELLTARVERFKKDSAPNLWVIDGGKTLLNLALNILESVGVHIDVIAISKEKIDAKAHRAKGAARDVLHTHNGSFNLPASDTKLQFFQRLRDEAHRFAINFHRQTKRRDTTALSTLQSKGVSAAAIKKLLNYFGSFDLIHNASYEEIKHASSKTVADKIFSTTKID
ncbi:MAG: excinuclease ABC subunit UvrC [Campylobacteraceae bacterium]|nr:excinuclease ABC subunit UvrC [Campylobacteraceae bacterium]